ncbi:MAG: triosephosphate isomerase [Patescibacteria group bacterium]|nr:triosephosphate isomerase [Patescibacteria group bacterium]
MAKKRIVIANWKMYIASPKAALGFARALRRRTRLFGGIDIVLAPQTPLIGALSGTLKGSTIKVAAQHVSEFEDGAHTGEVAAAALKAAGAQWVIVGHSERRARGEKEASIHQQLVNAAHAGLVPVLCVGERHRSEDGSHFTVIEKQLLSAVKGAQSMLGKIVIAYEPVWAIGKTAEHAMKPDDLEEMVIFIRKTLAEALSRKEALTLPVLYGGSVEPQNAAALIRTGISGFLVGHASVELNSFIEILTACKR